MIKLFPNVGQTLGKNGWFWLCRTFISNFSFDRLQSWSNFGSFCMFWQLWKIINQCNWILRINRDVFYQNWWQNDPIRTVSLVKNDFFHVMFLPIWAWTQLVFYPKPPISFREHVLFQPFLTFSYLWDFLNLISGLGQFFYLLVLG